MPESPSAEPSVDRSREIFSRISRRYDLVNALVSFGIDGSWRRVTVRSASPGPESRVLDLAAGTGDLTLAMARLGSPAEIVSTDLVPEMLEIARRKAKGYDGRARLSFQVADAQSLPFGDSAFDIVTVGFGVRNMPDRAANFREVRRVLRPGGRYVILEFSRPPLRLWRALYHVYLRVVVVGLGGLVSGDRASYRYLNDTIRSFPDQASLAEELRAAGFSQVSWRDLSGGIVAVHTAVT